MWRAGACRLSLGKVRKKIFTPQLPLAIEIETTVGVIFVSHSNRIQEINERVFHSETAHEVYKNRKCKKTFLKRLIQP